VWLCAGEPEVSEVTGPLGPDALHLSFGGFDERLAGRRGALKVALMDQRVVAGLGNMLSDEVLWRGGIHPRSSYREFSSERRRRLYRALQSVLRSSVKVGSIPRRSSWLSGQRGRTEPRCPRGHGPLQSSKVGGRTALWCARCQPEP
jgi:formamidopyrimidine-DNA glycosylase